MLNKISLIFSILSFILIIFIAFDVRSEFKNVRSEFKNVRSEFKNELYTEKDNLYSEINTINSYLVETRKFYEIDIKTLEESINSKIDSKSIKDLKVLIDSKASKSELQTKASKSELQTIEQNISAIKRDYVSNYTFRNHTSGYNTHHTHIYSDHQHNWWD